MRTRLWVDPEDGELLALARGGFAAVWDGLRGDVVGENRLRRVERLAAVGAPRFLKRFLGIEAKNALKLRLYAPRCASQAEREQRIIERLHDAGFGAPRVLAAGAELGAWCERRSLLLTAALSGRPLSEIATPSESLLEAVADCLGRSVASGVFLPDLGLDHVFVGTGDRLALLDFHNARTWPAPTRRELGRAVVRFFRSPGGEALLARRLYAPFAHAYLRAARRDEALQRALALGRARLGAEAVT
jgi:hypothetical protein